MATKAQLKETIAQIIAQAFPKKAITTGTTGAESINIINKIKIAFSFYPY